MNDKYKELGYTLKVDDEGITAVWFKDRLVKWWVKMPAVDLIDKVCYNDLNKLNGGEK